MIETNNVFDSKKKDAILKKMMQDLENNRKGLADYLLKQQKN
jgi:ribosomal protein S15P/S13E